ncbi:MAG: hypothetical protein H0U75_12330 [Legionella sp.]|nr:hypothetical protein [Legionella sp.]
MGIKISAGVKKTLTYVVSALGAAGGALQNYAAVELFLRGIILGLTPISNLLSSTIQVLSIAGGACNGLVNYFINLELLEGFLQRISRDKESIRLSGWRKFRYYAGIFIFSTTGILFGMMAFAFSASSPLAILALAAGVFVAIVMTIQELETWLQSFDEHVQFLPRKSNALDQEDVLSENHVLIISIDNVYKIGFCNTQGKYEEQDIHDLELLVLLQQYTKEGPIEIADHLEKINALLSLTDSCSQKRSLKNIFNAWYLTLSFKKACGHLIAAGNVLALSLLFTLSLVDVLVAFQVAAFPALVIGLTVAFTFGAFTEFYFYNYFLAKFCNAFDKNCEDMRKTNHAFLGYVCITVNALVNAALTYAGVSLLSGTFVLAGIGMPPLGLIIGLASICGVFAGSASFILGMSFWIRNSSTKPIEYEVSILEDCPIEQKPIRIQEPWFTPGLSFIQNMNAGGKRVAVVEQTKPPVDNNNLFQLSPS